MGKAYLLTGEPRIGKTTALLKVIDEIGRDHCGGFYTEELCSEGQRYGFEIVTLDGARGMLANIDYPTSRRVGRFGVILSFLEHAALSAVSAALSSKRYVVIDEIGPMQMCSALFQQVVLEVLKSSVPLIGTVSLDNAWITELCEAGDIELFPLSDENRDAVPGQLITALLEVQDG